jgi:hypothetical protein
MMIGLGVAALAALALKEVPAMVREVKIWRM